MVLKENSKDNSKKYLNKNINSHFDNMNYGEHFNNDIWFTIVIILIVCFIAIYFYIISSLRSYKTEWQKNKCNPLFMPFASLINPEESLDNEFLYTMNNFNECLNTLNAELAFDAKTPIDSIFASLKGFYGLLYQSFINVQKFLLYLFNLILKFFKMIIDKIQNLLIYIRLFFINTNNFLSEIVSIFTVMYYTIILVIKSWKLVFSLFVLGWLITIVVPSNSTLLIALINLARAIKDAIMALMSGPWGWLLFLGFVLLIIFLTVSFILALLFFILVLAVYNIFVQFLQKL